MIVAFEDSLMYLCSPGAAGEGGVPEGFVVMDDSRLDPCFDALKAGKNVFVHIHHGIRPLHHYLMTHYRYVKAAGGVVSSPDGNANRGPDRSPYRSSYRNADGSANRSSYRSPHRNTYGNADRGAD